MKLLRKALHCQLLALFISTQSSCALFERELKQTEPDVANVTISVKSALIESDAIDAAAIKVSMDEGKLFLNGFVGSKAEAAEAVRLATEAAVGTVIENKLVVK